MAFNSTFLCILRYRLKLPESGIGIQNAWKNFDCAGKLHYIKVQTETEMAGGVTVVQQLLRRKLQSQSTVSFAAFSHAIFVLWEQLF
ncbi:hypothetical protein K1719_033956 [Acacia pycnantha]|nr:hypothetical protein K1719_033956 [Acacia pycnantha]